MKTSATPVTRLASARRAVHLLKDARSELRAAGCQQAADYVARALKSAQGAERHALRLAAPVLLEAEARK